MRRDVLGCVVIVVATLAFSGVAFAQFSAPPASASVPPVSAASPPSDQPADSLDSITPTHRPIVHPQPTPPPVLVQPAVTGSSRLFAVETDMDDPDFVNRLLELDPLTGTTLSSVLITGASAIGGLEYLPDGRVVGLTYAAGVAPVSLFDIDLDTGAATLIGSTGLNIFEGGLAVHPISGVLYGVQRFVGGQLWVFTIDTTNGSPTLVDFLVQGVEGEDLSGIEFSPSGDLYVLDTRAVLSTDAAEIVKVGLSPFQVLSTVTVLDDGGLPLSLGGAAGFVRDDSTGKYFIIDSDADHGLPQDDGTKVLREIDPETGQTSAIGTPTYTYGFGAAGLVVVPVDKPPIPAISTWGLIAMACMLLSCGTIIMSRRLGAA